MYKEIDEKRIKTKYPGHETHHEFEADIQASRLWTVVHQVNMDTPAEEDVFRREHVVI